MNSDIMASGVGWVSLREAKVQECRAVLFILLSQEISVLCVCSLCPAKEDKVIAIKSTETVHDTGKSNT